MPISSYCRHISIRKFRQKHDGLSYKFLEKYDNKVISENHKDLSKLTNEKNLCEKFCQNLASLH